MLRSNAHGTDLMAPAASFEALVCCCSDFRGALFRIRGDWHHFLYPHTESTSNGQWWYGTPGSTPWYFSEHNAGPSRDPGSHDPGVTLHKESTALRESCIDRMARRSHW